MNITEFKELAHTLATIEGGLSIGEFKETPNEPNKLQNTYLTKDNNKEALIVEYIAKFNSIIASTDCPFFSKHVIASQEIKTLKLYKEKNITHKELNKTILTRKEFVEKIKNNQIEFKMCGHFNDSDGYPNQTIEYLKKLIIDEYDIAYDGSIGKYDNTWEKLGKDETMGDANINMRKLYTRLVEQKYHFNSKVLETSDHSQCSICGKRFNLVLINENTVSVGPGFLMKKSGDFNIECEFSNGIPYTKGEISVTSDLVIANFFKSLRADCPENKKYTDEYSLNLLSGRRNITKWKVENQNVAYGQMGNMSIEIFVNKTKDHVILTYLYDDSDKPKKKLKSLGFKKVGYISLSVWRWEATDINTLEKAANIDMKTMSKTMKEQYIDGVIVPVKHGIWEFNHYYDTTPDPERDELFIYAELKLKHG